VQNDSIYLLYTANDFFSKGKRKKKRAKRSYIYYIQQTRLVIQSKRDQTGEGRVLWRAAAGVQKERERESETERPGRVGEGGVL
jgi:hypothetical protein